MSKIMLSEAANCENHAEGYEGSKHQAGNQTGSELRTREYSNFPWTYVFRAKDERVRKNISLRMKVSCSNLHIGYSQPARTGLWNQLAKKDINYDPAKITVDCDCDCSALANASVVCAFMTYKMPTTISQFLVTAQMPDAYKASGQFDDVTASINLDTGAGLQEGDVLVTPGKHTAVCTSADSSVSTTPKYTVEATAYTPVYTDESKKKLAAIPALGVGNKVDFCDETDQFYFVKIGQVYGFVEKRLKKV